MGAITFQGITAARKRVAELTEGLREIAGGGVVNDAAVEIADRIAKVQGAFLARHVRTGEAAAASDVVVSGGLVTAKRTAYTKFIKGDPFRRGGFPPFVLAYAQQVLARRVLEALGDSGGTHAVATLAGEVESASAARAAKRDRTAAHRAAERKRR